MAYIEFLKQSGQSFASSEVYVLTLLLDTANLRYGLNIRYDQNILRDYKVVPATHTYDEIDNDIMIVHVDRSITEVSDDESGEDSIVDLIDNQEHFSDQMILTKREHIEKLKQYGRELFDSTQFSNASCLFCDNVIKRVDIQNHFDNCSAITLL